MVKKTNADYCVEHLVKFKVCNISTFESYVSGTGPFCLSSCIFHGLRGKIYAEHIFGMWGQHLLELAAPTADTKYLTQTAGHARRAQKTQLPLPAQKVTAGFRVHSAKNSFSRWTLSVPESDITLAHAGTGGLPVD
jgi:hypothetical protein